MTTVSEVTIQELLSAVYLLTAESVTLVATVVAQYVTATVWHCCSLLTLNNSRQQRIICVI